LQEIPSTSDSNKSLLQQIADKLGSFAFSKPIDRIDQAGQEGPPDPTEKRLQEFIQDNILQMVQPEPTAVRQSLDTSEQDNSEEIQESNLSDDRYRGEIHPLQGGRYQSCSQSCSLNALEKASGIGYAYSGFKIMMGFILAGEFHPCFNVSK